MSPSLLSYILLVLFILLLYSGLTKINFRNRFTFGSMFIILIAMVYLTQQEGSLTYSLPGGLKATLTKGLGGRTSFALKNSSNKDIEQTVKLVSSSRIEGINISKGNEYISVIEGGIGNNSVTYNVNIPPAHVTSGVVVSADTAVLFPVWEENTSKDIKHEGLQVDEKQ